MFVDSDSELITNHRRSNRRDVDGRDDLPLHNAALQELLADVMKHKDAWPFIRPVQKTEVGISFRAYLLQYFLKKRQHFICFCVF